MAVNIFDPTFYRIANPDLARAGLVSDTQLFNHFLSVGLPKVVASPQSSI
jgi:hypothetical protein